MANFKLVISDPKNAKSEVLEVKDSNAQLFMGRRIGEVVDAASSVKNKTAIATRMRPLLE